MFCWRIGPPLDDHKADDLARCRGVPRPAKLSADDAAKAVAEAERVLQRLSRAPQSGEESQDP
jgi:hypothetical protein